MASQHRRAVGIFSSRPQTASALQALSDSGFAMSHGSIIAKDPERQSAIAGVDVTDEAGNKANKAGTSYASSGSPNATFSGTVAVPNGRDNPYPHDNFHRGKEAPQTTRLPHASNPLEP